MSEKEKKLFTVCLILLAIVVLFLLLRRNSGSGAGAGNSYNVEGSSIGGTTIGGSNISPPSNNYNWGEGDYYESPMTAPNINGYQSYFNSQNDVNVQTFGLNELSQKYIPMFGLVGMTSVGNVSITQNVSQSRNAPVASTQAPLQLVYESAAPKPYQGYLNQNPAFKGLTSAQSKRVAQTMMNEVGYLY